MTIDSTVFSEFECDQLCIAISDGSTTDVYKTECVSKLEDESNVRKITKKCRDVIAKEIVKELGDGTANVTTHMPVECYDRLHGADQSGLKTGVTAIGYNSTHATAAITARVLDEDGNAEYLFYPVCVVNTGAKREVDNGSDDVVEVEVDFDWRADANGQGRYRVRTTDSALKTKLDGGTVTPSDLVVTTA